MEWPDLWFGPINLWSAPKLFRKNTTMSLTLEDVSNRLKQLPEVDVLEVLEITSEDLVEAFRDKIEEKMDYLAEDLKDEEYE